MRRRSNGKGGRISVEPIEHTRGNGGIGWNLADELGRLLDKGGLQKVQVVGHVEQNLGRFFGGQFVPHQHSLRRRALSVKPYQAALFGLISAAGKVQTTKLARSVKLINGILIEIQA